MRIGELLVPYPQREHCEIERSFSPVDCRSSRAMATSRLPDADFERHVIGEIITHSALFLAQWPKRREWSFTDRVAVCARRRGEGCPRGNPNPLLGSMPLARAITLALS